MMLTDHKNKSIPKDAIRSRIFLPTITSLLLGTQFGCNNVDAKKFLHKNNLKQHIQSAPSLSPKRTSVEAKKGGGENGGGAGSGGGGYSSTDKGDISGSSAVNSNVIAALSMVATVPIDRPQIPKEDEPSRAVPLEGEGGNHAEKNATDATFVSTPPSIGAEGDKVLVDISPNALEHTQTFNTIYVPGAESSPDHSADQSTMPINQIHKDVKLKKTASFNGNERKKTEANGMRRQTTAVTEEELAEARQRQILVEGLAKRRRDRGAISESDSNSSEETDSDWR